MSEVNQADDAVDHGVPKRNKGVDGASGQSAEKQLDKVFHGWSMPDKLRLISCKAKGWKIRAGTSVICKK